MTETEYVIVANRVRISSATSILREVLAGDEYGVNHDAFLDALKALIKIEGLLFNLVGESVTD